MMRKALLLFVVGACMLGGRSVAHAHGRFPGPTVIHFQPGDPDVILLQTTRGLIGTKDGGATWGWLCYEVIDEETFGYEDPPMVLLDSGTAIVADGNGGVLTLSPSWCDAPSTAPDPSTMYYIVDVAVHPTMPNVVYALTSSGGATVNRLFRSDNGGQTWTATNDGIAATFLETVAIAPSNPNIIYVSGTMDVAGVRTGVLYRSDDAGMTWSDPPITIPLNTDEYRPVVAGIDPTNADKIFIWIEQNERILDPPPDRLLVSSNGGQMLTPALASSGDPLTLSSLGGFAMSDDGSTVWVGDDADGGLWRSDDGGANFAPIDSLQINCLAWHDGELWACANNFTDGFALGRSTDLGDTFDPFMKFSELSEIISCPDGTTAASACGNLDTTCNALTELQVDLSTVAPECDADGGVPGADAGTGGGGGGDGGCAVAAPGSRAPHAMLFAGLLLGLALAWRSRSRKG